MDGFASLWKFLKPNLVESRAKKCHNEESWINSLIKMSWGSAVLLCETISLLRAATDGNVISISFFHLAFLAVIVRVLMKRRLFHQKHWNKTTAAILDITFRHKFHKDRCSQALLRACIEHTGRYGSVQDEFPMKLLRDTECFNIQTG